MIFHFFPDQFTGGFAGVDVFFVISGYLVTSILYTDILKGQFSFSTFYMKRIRRLFPSLIVVLSCCFIFACIFLLSHELKIFGAHLFAGSTFFVNFLYYLESGYFDTRSDLKPLLHLWSLCIEEQFYILWPLLIWAGFRLKKISLPVLLSIVFTISLILNLFLIGKDRSLSFFLLPTRLWELALGGLLVFVKDFYVNERVEGTFLSLAPSTFSRLKIYGSSFGMALIILSFIRLDEETAFPGYWAMMPVLGTTLVLLNTRESFLNKKILANPYLVYIGLISYPLYLWHWPIISFTNIVLVGGFTLWLKVALILVSFGLAVITYEMIEKPIRKRQASIALSSALCIGLLGIGMAGLMVWNYNGLPKRYPEIEAERREFRDTFRQFRPAKGKDHGNVCRNNFPDFELCTISNPQRPPTVALLGDSHANHFFPGLKKAYDKKGENLILISRPGTPPLYKVLTERTSKTSLDSALRYALKTSSIHTIVLSAFWGAYQGKKGYFVGGETWSKHLIKDVFDPNQTRRDLIFKNGLSRTFELLSKSKKKIFIIYQVPSLPFRYDRCFPRPFSKQILKCDFPVSIDIKKQAGYRNTMNTLLKKYPLVKTFDPVPRLCKNGVCSMVQDGEILYGDVSHLSVAGAELVFEKIDLEKLPQFQL